MVMVVNGVDMIPFLAKNGIKWQRADLDGPNAGRLLSGEMKRDRIAIKYRWDLTCKPLTSEQVSTVLKAIEPEYVTVSYSDPTTGATKTDTYYSNNIPATLYGTIASGVELWTGLEFPLIMK